MKTPVILVSILLGTLSLSAKDKAVKTNSKAKIAAKAQNTAATKSTPIAKTATGLSTDVRFGDQSVGGKYQLPMEALSVVENEKSIDDLIGVRKNFQDRVARTKGMR